MNLPTKQPQTEEEQRYEAQSQIVKPLIRKGVDYEIIRAMAEEGELGLDWDTTKKILAHNETSKEALKEMVEEKTRGPKRFLNFYAHALYAPFSLRRKAIEKGKDSLWGKWEKIYLSKSLESKGFFDSDGKSLSASWAVGNGFNSLLTFPIIEGILDFGLTYGENWKYASLAALGSTALNGAYELGRKIAKPMIAEYKTKRDRLVKEHMSELEKIANGNSQELLD
jgi:hypothetical protein